MMMKFKKKNYYVLGIVIMAGIFSWVMLNNSNSMKASKERYSITTDSQVNAEEILVTITISEPRTEELKLSYQGLNTIEASELLAGVSGDYQGKVAVEDTKDPNVKMISVEDGTNPLEMKFTARQLGELSAGEISLLDLEGQELVTEKIDFLSKSQGVGKQSISKAAASMRQYRAGNYPGDNGEPGPSTQEMAAANKAANEAIGFNPEVNVKTVGTWADLREAYNDATVTKIVLSDNISNTGNQTVSNRTTSIEIDGAGYTLYLGSRTLEIASPTDGIGFFHIHDMTAQQNLSNGLSSGGRYSFVAGSGTSTAAVTAWTFRTGNITTEPIDGKRVGRFIRAYQAMVQTYGYMNLTTTEENYYVGGMIIEDKTQWRGTETYANYSVVWFVENSTSSASTSKSMEFTVGKDALVSLKNETTGASYPAVYQHYRDMVIGEGSVYNSNMQGNSVRFDDVGSSLAVKADATINLLSRGTGSVVQFSANTTALNVEAGGSAYIVGSTTNPIVDITSGANRIFTMTSPKGYDIRNRNTGSTSNSPAVSIGSVQTNSFAIYDSDIDLWTLRSEILGPSQQTYAKVENFFVKAAGGAANVTTSESGLATFVPTQYRRIAGMNTIPEVEWTPVTDADKTYQARVKIGTTPTDTFDIDGNVLLQDVYASEGQASVTVTDTFGNTYEALTNGSGYAVFTESQFNTAGKNMIAHAVRGPYASDPDSVTTVIDVTPPEPAKVTGDRVSNSTKQLMGTDAEAKAKIYVDINGIRQIATGLVKDDGTWTYDLPRYLNTGDTVQIFLEDNAPEIMIDLTPAAPVTNTARGNINPVTDLIYRETVFKAATKYTVVDSLPDNPLMKKEVVSSGGGTTQVGDTLTYTLTATNGKSANLNTLWSNVVITDTIPEGLTFDLTAADIMINGVAAKIEEYTYDKASRLLTVKVGDLISAEAATVTFMTTVEQSVVGKTITNTAKALGFSPREAGDFIEGRNEPDRVHEDYSKTANVVNPGGAIFGILELVSAPDVINFGTAIFSPKGTIVNNPSYEGDDLVVKDGRAVQETWTLNAKLDKPLAKTDDPSVIIANAIRYVNNNNELILTGAAQPILSRKNADADPFNISGTWSPSGDGFKLNVEAGQAIVAGSYEATIVWELVAGP